MTLVDMNEAFQLCEYPFYKNISVENGVTCTLYSISTSYLQTVSVPFMNFEATVHRLSLAIIQLRSHEFQQRISYPSSVTRSSGL